MEAVKLILALLIALPVRGWVISMLWAWHVVPLGAPPISWWYGMGVVVVLATLSVSPEPKPRKRDEVTVERRLYYSLGSAFLALLLGFIFLLF